MSPESRDAFLRQPRIAKLATLNLDGSPNIVPVWFEWDGAEAHIFTLDRSAKMARIRNDPRVALSVEEPFGAPEAWVTIEGAVSVESGGYELAERLAPRYYTPQRALEALEQWGKRREHWVVLKITPRRIRSSGP